MPVVFQVRRWPNQGTADHTTLCSSRHNSFGIWRSSTCCRLASAASSAARHSTWMLSSAAVISQSPVGNWIRARCSSHSAGTLWLKCLHRRAMAEAGLLACRTVSDCNIYSLLRRGCPRVNALDGARWRKVIGEVDVIADSQTDARTRLRGHGQAGAGGVAGTVESDAVVIVQATLQHNGVAAEGLPAANLVGEAH